MLKNVIRIFSVVLLLLIFNNCNQPVIGGINRKNILGSEAKKKIQEAGNRADLFYLNTIAGAGINSSESLLFRLANGELIAISINLVDRKYYKRDSVDSCVSNIYAFILILESFVTTSLTCNIEEAGVFEFD